ncbi:MAG: Gfo/Idh/MocA family oxidoreductase [Acetobacteraceae bacterium]|nr:Gfo/Idh/MocA family oxidoreductase [Acetobacteraceae bacterium]
MRSGLRLGVVGAGVFGRYHALKAAAGPRSVYAGSFDPDAGRAAAVAAEAGGPAFDRLDGLIAACDAVIVASPTRTHAAAALAALRAGRPVLVEKPIAATLAEADEMAEAAARRGLVLQVGHLERFSAVRAAIATVIERPLFIEAVRIAPFRPRGTDVSVMLDLMIHDIDLALSLCPAELVQIDATGAPVIGAVEEDIGNARLRFADGCVASITASRISLKTERRMRIFARDRYLSADFQNRKLFVIRRTGEGASDFAMAEEAWQEHDSLEAEQAAFVASVLDGAPVAVDAAAGRRALDAALRIAASMAEVRADARAAGLI